MSDLAKVEVLQAKWEDIEGNPQMDPPVTELCTIAKNALEENARLRRIEAAVKEMDVATDSDCWGGSIYGTCGEREGDKCYHCDAEAYWHLKEKLVHEEKCPVTALRTALLEAPTDDG